VNDDHDIDHWRILDAAAKMAAVLAVCEFDAERRTRAIGLLAKWAGLAHDMKERNNADETR